MRRSRGDTPRPARFGVGGGFGLSIADRLTRFPRPGEQSRPVDPDAVLRCGRRLRRQVIGLEALDDRRWEIGKRDARPRVPYDLPALLRIRQVVTQLLGVA